MSLENNDIPEMEEPDADEKIEIPNETYDEDIVDTNIEDIEPEEKKANGTTNIVLYVIFAIIIILCLIVLAKNLFFNKDNNKSAPSSTTSSESTSVNALKKIEDIYVLDNLGDDYEIKSQDISETKAVSTYKNKEGEISLTQSTIADYTPEYDVNDENIVISDFHKGAGQDYKAYQINGKCYIVWTTDEYTFEIKTSMKKSESIHFIFNVQKAGEVSTENESE